MKGDSNNPPNNPTYQGNLLFVVGASCQRGRRPGSGGSQIDQIVRGATAHIGRHAPRAVDVDGLFCPVYGMAFTLSRVGSCVRRVDNRSIVADRFGNDVQRKNVIFCWKISSKKF